MAVSTSNSSSLRIVIVGGVAGGATAAARARRVNSNAEITILEKGPVVSFANCGLPYHLGGEIAERKKLLVATQELFWKRFRVAIRCRHEVTRIDRENRIVIGRNLEDGAEFQIPYDRLILSTGSEPNRPPFWENVSNVRHLWSIEDMDDILRVLESPTVRHATVVGAGFVGLEVAEQLHRRGMQVALIQQQDQVLGPVDRPFARMVESQLRSKGIDVRLGETVQSLECHSNVATGIRLASGATLGTDLVIVGAGVRPRVQLAVESGLAMGHSGGVQVNEFMQTSDPTVYAVGDMVEYQHGVTGVPCLMPLAGPANRAGRIAGKHAAVGSSDPMGPVMGTAIVRVFDLTIGCTGLSRKILEARQIPFRTVIIQAPNHASYFPGSQSLHLLVHYAPGDGRLLGAQAVGGEGVDKRIDVIATAMYFGGTVRQLAQLDLAYAPPFGSAKDPVHMAAFAACNDLDQNPNMAPVDTNCDGLQVVDVRTAKERSELPLVDSLSIPMDEFLDRWEELDPAKETLVVCHSGKRAHIAACWLQGKGFSRVRNLTGGMSIRHLLD